MTDALLRPFDRRALFALIGGGIFFGPGSAARAQGAELTEAAVLRDPDAPVRGNPDGDITIVEWFDYNCPYCRKIEPDLRQVMEEDGKIRVVMKDWPILGPTSVVAARLVLACKYQDKYQQAHDALLAVTSRLTDARIEEVLAQAGVDVARAKADLAAHGASIDALLKRTEDQATAFGFRGTPAFIVGKFRVPGVITKEQFVQAIADARKSGMGR